MQTNEIRTGIRWMGAVDWDRRLFDALIPLPDGTSYNAYLVQGSAKTALLDTVAPAMTHVLLEQLADTPRLDYIVSHHAEQDHSGAIPAVLAAHPEAQVVCTPQGKTLLMNHLGLERDRFLTMQDGETLSLGDKTLRFVHTPWVHWPETMCTYLPEDRMLFSCDWFGSHLATSDPIARDMPRVMEAAKRYYAEIMMPFRRIVQRNLAKLEGLEIDLIAPSHGPAYDNPQAILAAYHDWVSDQPKNLALVPYVSMHGSTRVMVERLVRRLSAQGVPMQQFDLTVTDLGKLAIALVDAASLVIGTPTFHRGPHPTVFYATHLANALRPKLAYVSVVGSYGWSTQAVEGLSALIPDLKVEVLPPVLAKGLPTADDLAAIDALGDTIAHHHAERGWPVPA